VADRAALGDACDDGGRPDRDRDDDQPRHRRRLHHQTDFNTEFVAAGALAVLLAVTADLVLVAVNRALTPWARTRRPT